MAPFGSDTQTVTSTSELMCKDVILPAKMATSPPLWMYETHRRSHVCRLVYTSAVAAPPGVSRTTWMSVATIGTIQTGLGRMTSVVFVALAVAANIDGGRDG